MKKQANIISFSTNQSKYVFDGVTSEIIPSSELIELIIREYYNMSEREIREKAGTNNEDEFEHQYQYIKMLIESGMFYQNEPRLNYKEEKIEDRVKSGQGSQLILVLTEECNMRCEYCVYSEKYPNDIGYAKSEMTFDIAKMAIDEYMVLHNSKVEHGYSKAPKISFYGGEPLLKMDLIKQIVRYVETRWQGVIYYLTTNALLLKGENAEFIAEHNFNLTISIDGNRENHDRNRVTIGGNKTFEAVYRNVLSFQRMKKNKNINRVISFNCCYDNYTNIYNCIKFFEDNYDMFYPFYCIFAPVKPFDTTYYSWVEEYMSKQKNKASRDEFKNSLKKVKEEFFAKELGNRRFKEIATSLFVGHLTFTIRNKWIYGEYNNSCTPLEKIAVYPDGTYALCEKTNCKLPIGNAQKGLDYERIQELANKFKNNFASKQCCTCSIKSLCNVCFIFMDEEGNIDKEFCNAQKKAISGRISEIYELQEQGIDYMEVLSINEICSEMVESMK